MDFSNVGFSVKVFKLPDTFALVCKLDVHSPVSVQCLYTLYTREPSSTLNLYYTISVAVPENISVFRVSKMYESNN